ncbi:MAG: bifunctional phosphopantothenoylcysteine decarboxylase/phosphopantothenate--cysteine ligase CoaBC [Candidatus Aminicenantes bacterium]|jgi:phosphopantothenoylcysteine decarboxylase/phosphopantothenate--cysteine ligase
MEKVVVGICSSISIYKSCEVIRGFQKSGYAVQAIMTKNAARLIQPLLLSAITEYAVLVDTFERRTAENISHISVAKETKLLVVAPATANMIGKMASGIADDFLSTFYMAVGCPVLVAPAMNEAMYLHTQTQLNIKRLKSFGVQFIEPDRGYLACGDEGWGRLASPEKIVEEGLRLMQKSQTLAGRKVLVTAGPTREYLDPVRFLSNRSSGKMGYAIAQEALGRGAVVTLISGPTHISPPQGVDFVSIQTTDEMADQTYKRYENTDVVIMAAAVSDVTYKDVAPQKMKKKALSQNVKLVPTQDILKKLGEKKGDRILIGFAAETENIETNSLEKIEDKNLDLIVANDVADETIGFGSEHNQVIFIYPDGRTERTDRMSKTDISRLIWDRIEDLIGQKN